MRFFLRLMEHNAINTGKDTSASNNGLNRKLSTHTAQEPFIAERWFDYWEICSYIRIEISLNIIDIYCI